MNYYERHLGDYAKDTAHLTMLEHGAYGLLLDRYYGTEAGIPADQAHRIARARTKEEKAAVDVVLAEFFTLAGGIWINRRAEEEIAKAHVKIHAAQENGKKGGRPKKVKLGSENETQEKPSGFPAGSENETQEKAHQTPDTSYSVSTDVDTAGEPAKITDPDEIIFGYGVPMLTNAGTAEKQARSFLGGRRKQHGDSALIDKLRECLKAKPLQPLEWLAAALPPKPAKGAGPPGKSRHSGFDLIDYKAGIGADGSF